ncbi:hypothetical protein T439DRAFT_175668 [Meredithblackwellia eburnea MCA 4105]
MTTLDPSHLPFLAHTSDNKTGQAVLQSVTPFHSTSRLDPQAGESPAPQPSAAEDDVPSWKGAWARRQERKEQERKEERRKGQIPIAPAIPDFRFEQGVMASLRPFLHRGEELPLSASEEEEEDEGAEVLEKKEEEKEHLQRRAKRQREEALTSLVSLGRITQESAKDNSPDIFVTSISVDYPSVIYVLFRDQIFAPLVQGVIWGVGGMVLGGLWEWNKARKRAGSLPVGRASSRSLFR